MSFTKRLSPHEFSEDRRKALKEAEKRRLSLSLVGNAQQSLSQYEKE